MRGWASGLEPMTTETRWSRTWSHLGILISITALLIYVTWRILFTLPPVGWNLVAAWLLIAFEAFPVIGLIIRAFTPVVLQTVRVVSAPGAATDVVSLRIRYGDWAAYRALSLWLFHTPAGVVAGLPDGAPAVAAERIGSSRRTPTLHRQYG